MARVHGGRRGVDRYRKVRRAIREVRDIPRLEEYDVNGALRRRPRGVNVPDYQKRNIVLAARRAVGAHRWPKLSAKLEASK